MVEAEVPTSNLLYQLATKAAANIVAILSLSVWEMCIGFTTKKPKETARNCTLPEKDQADNRHIHIALQSYYTPKFSNI